MIQLLCELAQKANQVKFTILKMDDGQFMVVIQPSLELAEDYPALSAPLQIVETADKLEAEIVTALQSYVPELKGTASNIESVVDGLKKEKENLAEKNKAKKVADDLKKSAKATGNAKGMSALAPPPMPPGMPDLFGETGNRTLYTNKDLNGTGEALDADPDEVDETDDVTAGA